MTQPCTGHGGGGGGKALQGAASDPTQLSRPAGFFVFSHRQQDPIATTPLCHSHQSHNSGHRLSTPSSMKWSCTKPQHVSFQKQIPSAVTCLMEATHIADKNCSVQCVWRTCAQRIQERSPAQLGRRNLGGLPVGNCQNWNGAKERRRHSLRGSGLMWERLTEDPWASGSKEIQNCSITGLEVI